MEDILCESVCKNNIDINDRQETYVIEMNVPGAKAPGTSIF